MALKPIGSKGLLTINGIDLVKFVPELEAIQIATDNAIGNGDATTLQAAKDDATTKVNAAKWDKGVLATDFDAVQSSGRWAVNATNVPNMPIGIAGELRVAWGATTGVQEYTTRDISPRVYYRRYSGGAWGTWNQGSLGARVDTAESRLNVVESKNVAQDDTLVTHESRLSSVETKNGTQDATLGNHETRIDAVETVAGLAPGDITDATMASIAAQPDTQFSIEQAGKFVNAGEFAINVKDHGAIGDGVADDTAAINTAAALATGFTYLFIPAGTYKITGTVTIASNLAADQATFEYYGTGTALVLGSTTASVVTSRKTFRCPRVVLKNPPVESWDGTSVGIQAINLNNCTVYSFFIERFDTMFWAHGKGQGFAHNEVHLGTLWHGRRNILLQPDATGWVNQNQFINGRVSVPAWGGTDTLDHTHVSMLNGGGSIGAPNNNSFYDCSFEGRNVGLYRVVVDGRYNEFNNCRWESPVTEPARVLWKSGASANVIRGGYDAFRIVETFEAGATGGAIKDSAGAYTRATSTTGQVIPNATWTAINSWPTPVGRRVTYDAATGEFTPRPGRWRINATVAFNGNATGTRNARLIAGGSTMDIAQMPATSGVHTMKLHDVYEFDGVKKFKIEVYQTSGADLALVGSSPYVKVQAEYLG